MPTGCQHLAAASPSAACSRSRARRRPSAKPYLTFCSRLSDRARITRFPGMASTTLLARPSLTVSDFRCTAVPGEKPFVEQHRCHSISYVRKGSFGYQACGKSHDLVAGSVLIGSPGTEFVCTHDHVCGDECLSFFFEPELVETIGERAEAWRIGAVPPLAELIVIGELAQGAADGGGDNG